MEARVSCRENGTPATFATYEMIVGTTRPIANPKQSSSNSETFDFFRSGNARAKPGMKIDRNMGIAADINSKTPKPSYLPEAT